MAQTLEEPQEPNTHAVLEEKLQLLAKNRKLEEKAFPQLYGDRTILCPRILETVRTWCTKDPKGYLCARVVLHSRP